MPLTQTRVTVTLDGRILITQKHNVIELLTPVELADLLELLRRAAEKQRHSLGLAEDAPP